MGEWQWIPPLARRAHLLRGAIVKARVHTRIFANNLREFDSFAAIVPRVLRAGQQRQFYWGLRAKKICQSLSVILCKRMKSSVYTRGCFVRRIPNEKSRIKTSKQIGDFKREIEYAVPLWLTLLLLLFFARHYITLIF